MPALHMPAPGKPRNDSTISPLQSPLRIAAPANSPPGAESTTAPTPDSPPRPPVSPITPVAKLAQLATTGQDPQDRVIPPPTLDFIAPPPPQPISSDDNTDAIALRSAIALLQIQRDRSRKDIRTLETIRNAAVAEPDAFIHELKAGRLRPQHPKGDLLGPTLNGSLDDVLAHESDSDDSKDGHARSPASSPSPPPEPKSKFGPVPEPQNVFRCPPVNWAKYHVVGESLDKLHAEQQKRPTPGEPATGGRAAAHVIAAPYSPFTDRLETRMQTRRGSKKPG